MPVFSPTLQVRGDYVSRCMWTRLEHWMVLLQKFWVRCHTALQQCPQGGGKSWDIVTQARATLYEHSDAIKSMCFEDSKARLRDSCIVLFQVFAAYRPKADLEWLGLPLASIQRQAGVLPFHVQHGQGAAITLRVAAALLDVADTYRRRITPEETVQEACLSHELVLFEGVGVRTLVWRGEKVKVDWESCATEWDFLINLAKRALMGQAVDAFLWKSPKYLHKPPPLKDRKHNLLKHKNFPRDLHKTIKSAGRGTYRLDLTPEQIDVLEYTENEQIVPYSPPSRSEESLGSLLAKD